MVTRQYTAIFLLFFFWPIGDRINGVPLFVVKF